MSDDAVRSSALDAKVEDSSVSISASDLIFRDDDEDTVRALVQRQSAAAQQGDRSATSSSASSSSSSTYDEAVRRLATAAARPDKLGVGCAAPARTD